MKPPLLLPVPGRAAIAAAPSATVRQVEVVSVGKQDVVVRAGRELLSLSGLRAAKAVSELTPGTTLRLELQPAAGSTRGQGARLLSLGGRMLEPPLAVQVRSAGVESAIPARLEAPVGASRPEASAAKHGGHFDPVRTLAAALGQSGEAPAPRLPVSGPDLATRLLQLIRLVDGAAVDVSMDEALPDDLPAEQRTALTTALADLRALAREPTPGLWRLLLLPFGVPGEVGELRLYLRDDGGSRREGGEDRAAADDAPPRRAVFEFDFSRLGRCQLDALCQGKRFDLVLRTQTPLEPDLRRAIEAVFMAARDAGGLTGELGFRPYELLSLPRPDRAHDHSLTV